MSGAFEKTGSQIRRKLKVGSFEARGHSHERSRRCPTAARISPTEALNEPPCGKRNVERAAATKERELVHLCRRNGHP